MTHRPQRNEISARAQVDLAGQASRFKSLLVGSGVVTLERSRRVGRSQAASIFWGLVSVFFAAAACYYFWKYHENETAANVLRDQVLNLEEQRETLSSQKDQLQSNISETEAQLKTREDFVQDKEAKLGEEESRLEALATQSDSQSEQSRSQAAVVKKFNDAVRKLVKGTDTDVVVRGGRPVLRVPESVFFDFGGTTLKPDGKSMLRQIAQALDGRLDRFELRIDTFTDSEGESDTPAAADKPDATEKTGSADTTDKTAKTDSTDAGGGTAAHLNPGWELSGRRAGMLARFIREQTSLPFQNVLVVPRADFQPIIPSGNEGHARNRRIEITITPVPAAFHPEAVVPATPDHPVAKPANASGAKSGDQTKAGNKDKTNDQTKAGNKDKAAAPSKAATKKPVKPEADDSSADMPPPKKSAAESSKE